MTVFEHGEDAIVVDAGLAFPRDEHLGVDLVLPDFTYLRERRGSVRAVVLTHAHEDHVGGLPYLLREVDVPEVWATRLTLGLVKSKLDEHGLLNSTELREIDPEGAPMELGPFRLEFIRMAHSVPDNVAVVIEAGGLRLLHTSDWKLDHTPIDGFRTDVGQARRDRQPRRRPAPLRLDERRAARVHRLRAAGRRGVPPDHPAADRPCPRRVLRLERPPHAAGDRRRRPDGPQGGDRRPLDAQEPQHRREPRVPGDSRGDGDPAEGARRVRAARGADPLHGQPGRADVGAHPHRLQRPPGGVGRARRHGDPLRAAGARERAARARHDQPAFEGGRGGAARGERARSRVRSRDARRRSARCTGSCGRRR